VASDGLPQGGGVVIIRYKVLKHGAQPPAYMTAWAAGMDLFACLPTGLKLMLVRPGDRVHVPTGVALEIPPGYEGQIRPRSGWAAKHGVTVLNAPGTVDADYRGEIGVVLINHGDRTLEIQSGERIAQLVIAPVERVQLECAEELSDTTRGTGGFGSTGKQ
jgi:dUTP pyrophosphatase